MSAQPETPIVQADRPIFRDGLRISKLRAIQEELSGYRDYAPVGPTQKKGSGQVLPFVRGLYLSAKVIYFIREVISTKNLDVNWGHIIHETQIYCSPECDIIIHRKGSHTRWNGNVLDFHFVDLDKVVAVISCKSRLESIDEDYCKQLKAFGIPAVGLIGEVCDYGGIASLRERAVRAGYADLWSLAVEDAVGRRHDETILLQFIKFLEAL